ncbi:MAG: L-threonylcarbamoyladenylate synthase [Dehalococcoidia bacterium]
MTGHRLRATEVVTVDPQQPDPAVIARAAAILRAGGLVAFPTETVYGLGADATSEAAVRSIFTAKERAEDDPLIVHIASADELDRVAGAVPGLASFLAGRFWPGPLTIVLERHPSVAPAVSAGLDTVAVRVPSHPIAQALLMAAGIPIAAPSANRFMRTSATTAGHVIEDLGGRIDLVLDGGPATAGIESTVVAVEGSEVRVLRHGAITAEELEEALRDGGQGTLAVGPGDGPERRSPGMMARHYAPRARLIYVTGAPGRTLPAMLRAIGESLAAGERVGAFICSEDLPLLPPEVIAEDAGPRDEPATVAARVFRALRALDARGAQVIVVCQFAEAGLGRALHDRLTRAAYAIVEC